MNLAHHSRQPSMTQPLLHHQEYRFAGFSNDEPIGMQPDCCQSGGKQITLLDHPQHHPLQARCHAGYEQASGGAMLNFKTISRNLVQARKP